MKNSKYKKGRILFVNLTNQKFSWFEYSDLFLRNYLGGRGFNSRILYEFRDRLPMSNPFSSSNIVCVSSGLLAGTSFPSSGRTTVSVLKSPVTQMFSDANLGGFFGPTLRLAGIDAVVITGVSDEPVYLHIQEGEEPKLYSASRFWHTGNSIVTFYLKHKYKTLYNQVLTIGTGGSNGVFCATVSNGLRTGGGGGVGAVLGSKKLKAICVSIKDPRNNLSQHRSRRFRSIAEAAEDRIKSHPVYDMFRVFGTTSLVEIHSGIKYFPTKNWTARVWNKWKKISGKAVLKKEEECNPDYLEERKGRNELGIAGCRNCPVLCSGEEKIEYETLNCLGAKIGVDDLSWIVTTNSVYFNDGGIDVIQTTSIISALMEMTEDGVLDRWKFKWGDKDHVERFVKDLIYRTDENRTIGRFFVSGFLEGLEECLRLKYFGSTLTAEFGSASTAKLLYDRYFVHIKNAGLSGVYLGSETKAVALAFATSSRGADHLRSLPTLATYANWYLGKGFFKKLLKMLFIPFQAAKIMRKDAKFLVKDLYRTYHETFGVPLEIVEEWRDSGFLFDKKSYSGWAKMVKFTQEMYAVCDSVSMCRFVSPWRFGVGPEMLVEAIESLTGIKMSWGELLEVGERIYAIERDLNYYHDTGVRDDVPDRFFRGKAGLDPVGFWEMVSEYYALCGYDGNGQPSRDTVNRLIKDDFNLKI